MGAHAVADPEGFGGSIEPPLLLPVFKYPMKINNLVSMRPKYFIFMEYLRKMRQNQQNNRTPTPLYIIYLHNYIKMSHSYKESFTF